MMLRTGNLPSTVSAVNGVVFDLVAFEVVENVVFEFFMVLIAHVALAERGDFAGVLEGALGVDLRERRRIGRCGRSGSVSEFSTAAGVAGDGVASADAVVPLLHAVVASIVITSAASESPNHRGHRGARRKTWFVVSEGFIVAFCLLICEAFFIYDAFFSARFLRCVGCTNQAIAMLNTYRSTMGAAKMHMFTMSGVGVMMRATNEDPEDRVADVAPHPAGADNPHKREEEHQDGHLEDRAMPRMMVTNSCVYSSMVIIGWNCLPKSIRKLSACG